MAITAKVSTPPKVSGKVVNNSISKTVGIQNVSKAQDSFTINASEIPISLDNSSATNVRDALNETAIASGTQTFTSKTINADDNTITNLEVDNIKGATLVVESEGIGSNDNDTTLPTSAAVKDYVDTQVTAQDLDFQGDSGGALNIDLDSEALDIAGGTGIDTVGSANTVTVAIDSTVATKTYVGTQVTGVDTLDEMNDTNLTTPTEGALLRYHSGSDKWIDDNNIEGGAF